MVDVRDMLCAQALAVVAQALAALSDRQDATLEVWCNTDDVKRDLLVWAQERGCEAQVAAREDGDRLVISKDFHA